MENKNFSSKKVNKKGCMEDLIPQEILLTFSKTLDEFIVELKIVFHEELKDVNVLNFKKPQKIKQTLNFFMNSINIEYIQKKNSIIFENDFFITSELNLSYVWSNEKNNTNNQNAIWKYLQTLTLLGTSYLKDEENASNMLIVLDTKSKKNDEDIPEFLMNTKIGQIAKDIAGEFASKFDIEEMMDESKENMQSPNIQNIMKKIFSSDILSSVGNTVQEKIKDLKKEDLMGEVGEIMENINQDPKMKNVMSSISKETGIDLDSVLKNMGNLDESSMPNIDENQLNRMMGSLLGKIGGDNNMDLQSLMGNMMGNMANMPNIGENPDEDFQVLEEMFTNGENIVHEPIETTNKIENKGVSMSSSELRELNKKKLRAKLNDKKRKKRKS